MNNKPERKVWIMNGKFARVSLFVTIAAICMLAFSHCLAGDARLFSLGECIRIALKNNPEIGIAQEGIKRTENNLLFEYGGLLPNFSLNFSTGHAVFGPSSIQFDAQGRPVQMEGFDYESYSFSMSSNILLYDGGGNINRIRSAMRGRDAAREELEYSRDLVSARVIRAYYDLVRNMMLLNVAEESVEQSMKSLERTEALLEVGSATRADVLKARVRYSNTKLNLIKSRNAVELVREDLVTLLNMPGGEPVNVDTSMVIELLEPDLQSEMQFALEHRSDLKSLDYNVSSARAGISAARSGWLPRLAAGFNYGWSDRQMADNLNFFKNEYSWSVGAQVSLNVFDRFATSSNVGAAKASHRIAEYSLEKAKLDATKEIKGLVFTIREASERITVASETVEQAMEDLRLAEARYRLGAGTMLETIDAQVALAQAKADVIDARCDYLIATADLSRATGRKVHR